MKRLDIVKIITQLLFWLSFMWIFEDYCDTQIGLVPCIIIMAALVCACWGLRRVNRFFVCITAHILLAAAAVAAAVIGIIEMPVSVLIVLYCVFSFIFRAANLKGMDQAGILQAMLFVFVYFLASFIGLGNLTALFGLFFTYLMLMIIQNTMEKNHAYLSSIKEKSVLDTDRMYNASAVITVMITAVIALFAFFLSMLGRAGIFTTIWRWLRNALRSVLSRLSFLKRELYIAPSMALPEESYGTGETISEQPVQQGGSDIADNVIKTAAVILIVILGFLAVVGICIMVYRSFNARKNNQDGDEEIVLAFTRAGKKKEPGIVPEKAAGPRKSIRKLYKKRVRRKRDEDNRVLVPRTPMEQKQVRNEQGEAINQEFVDIYEKARYSKENISKDDVRRMQGKL